MRESGSPKVAVATVTEVYTPDDLGMNVVAYPVFPENVYAPAIPIDVSRCSIWSIFILVTGGGNVTLTLKVMEETIETNILASFTVSAAITAGAYRHFTFGPVGSTVPVVPARLVRFGVGGAAAGGNVTMRLYGRTA